MLMRCVVLCVLCGILNSEISISKLKTKPEKFKDVEGCYIEELDIMIPFDQSQPSTTECMEFLCEKNWVSHISCGLAVAMPPVELVEEKDKPYPDCCPRLKDSPLVEQK